MPTSDGRSGIAITADGGMRGGSAGHEYTIILEPEIYRLMSGRQIVKNRSFRGLEPGTPIEEINVYTAGWTNEDPHRD